MKISYLILIVLAGTLVVAMPAKSYADPQLDTLVNIATQARDNLGATISQMSSVPADVNQLYGEGSNETDALKQAASQQDVTAAKEHFLAAMKFFKETNDKINSLGSTSATTDQQKAQIQELRGEVVRLESVGNLLKTIASQNMVPVNFTAFDQMLQTANQDLDSGNTADASKQIGSANDFIANTHNALNQAAQEKISQRAKDFTERQIAQMNQTQSAPAPETGPTPQQGTGGQNGTANPNTPSSPPTAPPPNASPNAPPTGNSNTTMSQNPQEMVSELKKLVAEGKVDQAIGLIKQIQAYQHEQLAQKAAELQAQQNQVQSIPPPAPSLVQNATVPPVQNNQAKNTNPVPPPLSGNATVPNPPQNNMPVPPPIQNRNMSAQNSTTPTPPLPTPPNMPQGPQNGTVQVHPNIPVPPQNGTSAVPPDHSQKGNTRGQYQGNQHYQDNGNQQGQGNGNQHYQGNGNQHYQDNGNQHYQGNGNDNNRGGHNNQGNGYNFPWIQGQNHRRN